ncbi:MAG: phosphatase PAP2 family protein [Parachlamydiaceae bacterium]|nr:MAG: phosphatase PAP2 family protein [Parachlamydiaceae bacterium]
MTTIQKHLPWLLPLLCVLAIAPLTPGIDLSVERYFFREGHFQNNGFLNFMYVFGVIPGWILALGSLGIVILSYVYPYWKPWRIYALIPLLTMILGAGVVIDKSFKDHWGRPRPKQIKEFGGHQQFHPFYKPNLNVQPEPAKSFPSGHCSMGFIFFSLAFAGRRAGKEWVFKLGIALAFILGTLLAYTRMAQGGHFFSDVFMSAIIMWWTSLFVNWLVFQEWIYKR